MEKSSHCVSNANSELQSFLYVLTYITTCSVGSCRTNVVDNLSYPFRRSRLSMIAQSFLSSIVFIFIIISNIDLAWFRKQRFFFFFNKYLICIDSVTNLSRSDSSDQIQCSYLSSFIIIHICVKGPNQQLVKVVCAEYALLFEFIVATKQTIPFTAARHTHNTRKPKMEHISLPINNIAISNTFPILTQI